jgi:8-oxo-dGTP pyrophosphatase MutT (NUDIX family)
MLTVHSVTTVEVRLSAEVPVLSPSVRNCIEDIWTAEQQRRGNKLFNHKLFSISAIDSAGHITGWLVEYKWFLAQRRDPSLYDALRVRPLAVTGLLHCAEGIVTGRRSRHVEQDAGFWELVPSGGVDGSTARPDGSISLDDQLLAELEEEVGITRQMIVSPPEPFATVYDEDTHVLDIGVVLRTNLSKAAVISTFNSLENREYVELECLPRGRVEDLAEPFRHKLASVSRALLALA